MSEEKHATNFLDRPRLNIEPTERIGGLFPENKVTLLTGLPGTGKTYSTIKAFNVEGITPIYFNLDETVHKLEVHEFGFGDFAEFASKNNKWEDLSDHVVIIDTYIRMYDIMKANLANADTLNEKSIVNMIEDLVKKYNITLVIIAHSAEFVGKDGIFRDNETLVRSCSEHIHIEKITSSSKKEIENGTSITFLTRVNKGRGSGGARAIVGWMRGESEVNKFVNKEFEKLEKPPSK